MWWGMLIDIYVVCKWKGMAFFITKYSIDILSRVTFIDVVKLVYRHIHYRLDYSKMDFAKNRIMTSAN